MKIKKLLLFILLFLTFLFLSSNVSAYVVSEGGLGKYYLQDLPFEDNEESVYKSVFLFNSTTNEIICIRVENTCFLGFSRINNRIYEFDDYSTTSKIFYYKCSVDLSNGLYVGTEWSYYSGDYISVNSNYTYIGGTTHLYPCYNNNFIITNLPDNGMNWSSNFAIGVTSDNVPILQFFSSSNNIVYVDSSNRINSFLDAYNGTFVPYDVYRFVDNNWVYKGTLSNPNSVYTDSKISNFIYFNKDVYDSVGSLLYSNTNQFFRGLFEYNIFPYILNSQEDLAKGNEDIIIMPR